jgi:glycerophosphoryl diester phosphodiesterase
MLYALAAVRRSGGGARPIRLGHRPAGFAHRGASARAPENTLEAFALGLEDGAGALEMDVHLTRDWEVVVIHDDTVDRTTDGSGAVSGMTLEELRGLDAGYAFPAYRGRGLRIPALREIYEAFPEAFVNVEIKERRPGAEEAVLAVVREAGAEGRTLVASARHAVVRRFREESGGTVPTAASRREILAFFVLSRLGLEGLASPGYDALQIPARHRGLNVATERFFRAAHARGVRVDVWTVNDPAEMRRLLDLGADGIMSDRPSELARVLAERR